MHEEGHTWAFLAEQLGYAPGEGADFVRKVASGAKRGANLAERVDELTRVGKVRKPVERRASKDGPARVRGKHRGEAPRPVHVRKAPPASSLTAEGGWRATVDVEPTPARFLDGDRNVTSPVDYDAALAQREEDRQALLGLVRRAAQGRRRVAFRVWMGRERGEGDPPPVELYMKGGYAASTVLAQMRAEGDDPLAWLGALPDDAELGMDWLDDLEGQIQQAVLGAAQSGNYRTPEWLGVGEVVDVVRVELIAFGKRSRRTR